ncbi:MAG: hypothetical protein WCE75_01590, partial [Terracidiphilus sp.]
METRDLPWQSKLVLLLVLPATAAEVVLRAHWWAVNWPPAAIWSLGLSLLLGLAAWQARSATQGGAFAGGLLTACLMLDTFSVHGQPWRTALVPVCGVLLLTGLATRLGRG